MKRWLVWLLSHLPEHWLTGAISMKDNIAAISVLHFDEITEMARHIDAANKVKREGYYNNEVH